jgi:hypothetical protein
VLKVSIYFKAIAIIAFSMHTQFIHNAYTIAVRI